jgi:hypothetical protein
MRLGRLPHSPAAVARAPAHLFGALAPLSELDRSAVEFRPNLYGNDTYPDCTAVALANAARAVTALEGWDLAVDGDAPLKFYGDVVGNPPDLALTHGAQLLTVLDHMSAQGFCVNDQTPLVGRYGTVRHDRASLALAMARFGGGYWGVTLRERDVQNVGQSAPWDVTADDGDVVGGHCVLAWDYTGLADDDTVRIATWGAWQPVTWRWVRSRLDEAWGLVFRQLVRAEDSLLYDGVDPDGLVRELES